MPSPEQQRTPEQNTTPWEMDLSWENLVVAMLERKVIPADAPRTQDYIDSYLRRFRAVNGDHVAAWGVQYRKDFRAENAIWSLAVTPNGEGRHPYRLRIRHVDLNNPSSPYEITHVGSSVPLSPEASEAVLNTVVTMAPLDETEYNPSGETLNAAGWGEAAIDWAKLTYREPDWRPFTGTL